MKIQQQGQIKKVRKVMEKEIKGTNSTQHYNIIIFYIHNKEIIADG